VVTPPRRAVLTVSLPAAGVTGSPAGPRRELAGVARGQIPGAARVGDVPAL